MRYMMLVKGNSDDEAGKPPSPELIEAIGGQDFAIVHVMVFLGSLLYILAYLVTDVAYTFVDPRVRLA